MTNGSQAVYFDGINQCLSFPGDKMPRGNSPRTLEFWLKSNLRRNAFQNHESVVELGTQTVRGSAFRIFTEIKDSKTYLSFWGHNLDPRWMAVIPDDEWHFVAVTFDGATLKCFLDSIFQYEQAIQLATDTTGPCYIGGKPERGWYFNGAVRNVSIWNHARSETDIRKDMIPYHGTTAPYDLKPTEPGLIASFPLNEGAGTAFKSLGNTITGQFVNNPGWTKPIVMNPNPIDEGIWFVIQNKNDVDSDLGIPARRMALRVNDQNQVVMAAIPMEYGSDFSAFLWRTLKVPDAPNRFRLVNKKLGEALALDCSQQQPTIGNFGNYSGQYWLLQNSNSSDHGTNVYTMSNVFITEGKALQYLNGQVTVATKDGNDPKQAWVFQPTNLAIGYHIPSADASKAPHTKKLEFENQFVLHGTNSTSDWAMLNAHLIYRNYFNAIGNNGVMNCLKDAREFSRREVNIITRYDLNDFVASYPLNTDNGGIFDKKWFVDFRGGSGNDPRRNLSVTFITEEMMCKVGVISRGESDKGYREFEQVVHEFSHAIDSICHLNTSANPLAGNSAEWFPWQVQYWFNSAQSAGAASNRKALSPDVSNYLKTIFKESNTWLPPRKLREREPEK